jgi:hypothetical protein
LKRSAQAASLRWISNTKVFGRVKTNMRRGSNLSLVAAEFHRCLILSRRKKPPSSEVLSQENLQHLGQVHPNISPSKTLLRARHPPRSLGYRPLPLHPNTYAPIVMSVRLTCFLALRPQYQDPLYSKPTSNFPSLSLLNPRCLSELVQAFTTRTAIL